MDEHEQQLMRSQNLVNALGHQGQMRTQSDIAAMLRKLAEANQGVAECPWCGGQIPKRGVEVCTHCAREIAWVESPSNPEMFFCCKPDPLEIEGWTLAIARYELEQEENKKIAEKLEIERKEQEEKAMQSRRGLAAVLVVLILGLLILFSASKNAEMSDTRREKNDGR